MKKKAKLRIGLPQPCSEDWDQMNVVQKGRFCGSCEKLVIDFTNMSDQALIEFFVTKNQRACGRFRTDQLDRNIVSTPPSNPSFHRGALLLAGGLSLLSLQSNAQTESVGKVVLKGDTLIQADPFPVHTMGEVDPAMDAPDEPDSSNTKESVREVSGESIKLVEPPEVTAGVPMIMIEPVPKPSWKRFIPFRRKDG
ncbi:MAG: hypothetical protein RLP15_07165 [Cryomorphaceae bacterium]